MIIYTNVMVDFIIILLIAGIDLTYIESRLDSDSFLSTIVGIIGISSLAISILVIIVEGITLLDQYSREPIIYQQMKAESVVLEQSLSQSSNAELYIQAVNFNTELAKIQAAANNPDYSISFSGTVDWSTIDPIQIVYEF